ncbi:zinc finger and SCAN domain-containing protein 21-like isoform X5, partial [Lates japonicus]
MSRIADLKEFVSERLHAAASEILGAIEKTIGDYEVQASRLKEENDRHRSVLDIILKSKLPQTEGRTLAAAGPGASVSSSIHKARGASCQSSDLQCVFTSRTNFLKFAAKDSCPYCRRRIQATETHLMRRHYLFAVHFTEEGTEKFVVPCMCKDRIQGRSHWHCPYCKKIIYRKCNFEGHISKQHGFTILQQNQDAEIDQPSVFEEEVPLSPEPWCQHELGSLDQEGQKASLLLQVKTEQEEETWRQGMPEEHVSHLEFQHSQQLQIKSELIQQGDSQVGEQSPEADHSQDSAFNIICVDSFIQDISEINQSSIGPPLPNSSSPLESQPDGGVGEIWQPARDSPAENGSSSKTEESKKNHTPCSRLTVLNSKRKRHAQRSLPPMSFNMKKSKPLSASQNPTVTLGRVAASFWFCTRNMAVLKIQDQPSLLRAIFNVDPDEVRSLIFKKEDVNIQDNEKRTPLHAAAYLGDAEIIELLILSGARVNAKDNKWLTPLHRAVASCSENAVAVLLKHSADVNARDKNWQTPLHVAASNKAVRCAEALVPLLSNVNVSDRAGRTALHHAAFSGHVEMVKLLLSRGANINAFDKKDRRAIHWAAYMGHLEVVKLLVASGAEVDCKDKKAYTELHAAASSGMSSTVHYLLSLGVHVNEVNAYGNTPLHLACYNGQDVVVSELIEAGANVNQVNERGFSALHFASSSRQGALCQELLLAHGAHINMRSKDGKTPLHMAATHGRFSCSQALIQNGAEIDCEDKSRNTALHIAARYGHELIITALIKHGACTAKKGIHGMFPLHLAALSGFSDCCRKLLSSGFDIDTPDDFGRTCLHAAAAGGNLECLNLLLNIGADFNRKDNFGRTPLHYASANCNYQCVFALVGSGASINELDQRGCSPLHYAAAADTDGKCVEYLLRNDADPAVRDKQGYSAVHYASAYGRTLCLELMASETPLDVLMETSGTDILSDSENQAPVSPLHLAAYHGHCGALEVLLSSLLDVDVRSPEGRTPLSLACSRGHQECVSLLLHHGASPMTHDYTHKKTAIHAAAMNGHPECLRLLMSNNDQRINVDVQDTNGQTPLMLAVLNGHTECVYSLLSQGASVENQDRWGRTALHRG